jgi:tRNA (cmo5U34)-methyltransferase
VLGCHVVVSGSSGAGKTTLASSLAEALGVALLSKDRLKEALHAALPATEPEQSLQLSFAAMQVLYDIAGRSSTGLVLEANWQPDVDVRRLSGLTVPLVQVFCDVPPELAQQRLRARVASGERHRVHRDAMAPELLRRMVEDVAEPAEPLTIPGPLLRVDTSAEVDIAGLAERILAKSAAEPAQRFTLQPGGWSNEEQVDAYLARVDRLGPRQAGEEMLVDLLPPQPKRILDLGCGDGRLSALVMAARPSVRLVVMVDMSPPMLARARERFAEDTRVEVVDRNLTEPLSDLGTFDVVVAGCAIHHLEDLRKRTLFQEIAQQLHPGGLFANLEVVQSATPELHAQFLAAVGRDEDDPEDRLAPVDAQLDWMRQAGLAHVECLWRWRGLALLAGVAPLLAT